jgi:cell division septation protein DedD
MALSAWQPDNNNGGGTPVRWIFYSLLVVNLVYLGVQLTKSLAPRDAAVSLRVPIQAAGGEPLVLLSERSQPTRVDVRRPEAGSLCAVVGPWESHDAANAGAVQLRAAGLPGRVRALSIEKDRLNWVYLPPYADRERALRVLHELQDHGVDSFVVKEGEDANAISLGYFSSAESAEGLRVKMRNAGYPAFVRETSRAVTEYWVYLADQAPEEKPELDIFLQANQSLKLDWVACS